MKGYLPSFSTAALVIAGLMLSIVLMRLVVIPTSLALWPLEVKEPLNLNDGAMFCIGAGTYSLLLVIVLWAWHATPLMGRLVGGMILQGPVLVANISTTLHLPTLQIINWQGHEDPVRSLLILCLFTSAFGLLVLSIFMVLGEAMYRAVERQSLT